MVLGVNQEEGWQEASGKGGLKVPLWNFDRVSHASIDALTML